LLEISHAIIVAKIGQKVGHAREKFVNYCWKVKIGLILKK